MPGKPLSNNQLQSPTRWPGSGNCFARFGSVGGVCCVRAPCGEVAGAPGHTQAREPQADPPEPVRRWIAGRGVPACSRADDHRHVRGQRCGRSQDHRPGLSARRGDHQGQRLGPGLHPHLDGPAHVDHGRRQLQAAGPRQRAGRQPDPVAGRRRLHRRKRPPRQPGGHLLLLGGVQGGRRPEGRHLHRQ
jgi:hypothetical protein